MSELLLVDATEELQALAQALEQAGFALCVASMAEAAQRLMGGELFAAMIVNLMDAPNSAKLRELLEGPEGKRPAVLGVVRREGLGDLDPELPLDDFISFPALPEEAALRLRRVLRRRDGEEDPNMLRRGDLTIDHTSYKVYIGSHPVELTYKEYELLRFLALNEGKVCTREMLLNRVWGYDFYGGARTVDVHIRRLRSKIEDRYHTLIETVRNVGYRFRAE
jgi:two-component system, OmpR family, alkaline phosphatase synthesis response regulator PhoP